MDKDITALWDKINTVEKSINKYIEIKNGNIQSYIDYVAIMTDTYVGDDNVLDKIKSYFTDCRWTDRMVHTVAEKGVITPEQYKEITGEDYAK